MTRQTARVAAPEVAMVTERLRARGERVTRSRLAVLDVLDAATRAGEHLSADQITRRATQAAPGLHRATVYRALSTLDQLGALTHTHLGGEATIYHLRLPDPPTATDQPHPPGHGHLHCTTCGTVTDVSVDLLRPLVERVGRDLGFRIAPDHTALLGTCVNCAAAT